MSQVRILPLQPIEAPLSGGSSTGTLLECSPGRAPRAPDGPPERGPAPQCGVTVAKWTMRRCGGYAGSIPASWRSTHTPPSASPALVRQRQRRCRPIGGRYLSETTDAMWAMAQTAPPGPRPGGVFDSSAALRLPASLVVCNAGADKWIGDAPVGLASRARQVVIGGEATPPA